VNLARRVEAALARMGKGDLRQLNIMIDGNLPQDDPEAQTKLDELLQALSVRESEGVVLIKQYSDIEDFTLADLPMVHSTGPWSPGSH
jgi:hypothetical protein